MTFDEIGVFELSRHDDERGYLLKAIEPAFASDAVLGEIYFVGARPGAVRGNHFHRRTTEWFVVVSGQARLTLVDTRTPTRRRVIPMGDRHRVCVRVPPRVAHAFEVEGEEDMLLMALADRAHDPEAPDVFPFEVVESASKPVTDR